MYMKKGIFPFLVVFMITGSFLTSVGCGTQDPEQNPMFRPLQDVKPEILVPRMLSRNVLEGAQLVGENVRKSIEPSARFLLTDDDSYWAAYAIARQPADGQRDLLNTYAEIRLSETSAFNTAIIEEVGNEVQYFRLQAWLNEAWTTIYQSEKIECMRLLSFDTVSTDRIRLSIDKFRSTDNPAKIRSIKLYNEPKREVENFNTVVYQRFDRDVPSEIVAGDLDYARMYARYYDVYNTVIIFDLIQWDKDGNILIGLTDNGRATTPQEREEVFARELAAFRQLIAMRTNQSRDVRIIVVGIAWAGAAWADVAELMHAHRDRVADNLVDFMVKYNLDGLDINWEFPFTDEDWINHDAFMRRLHSGMKNARPDSILSTAIAAWGLNMADDIWDLFDQIQLMNYDGWDMDGFQSSLHQAQWDLNWLYEHRRLLLDKINIGIAAYGRPLTYQPFWGLWRDIEDISTTYWNNKHYNVVVGGQLMDAAYCSPALAGDKLAYALFTGAGGVMVFRLATDKLPDNPNAIVSGLENTLKRYVNNW